MQTQTAALRRVPVFSTLSEEAWNTLLGRSWRTTARRREFIYVPGDHGAAVFVVLRGRVRVLLLSADGHEATLELLEPGDLFGEEALTDGNGRCTAAQAWEETQLAVFPPAELKAVLPAEA